MTFRGVGGMLCDVFASSCSNIKHQDTELDASCKNMIYVLHNENAGMFINKCLPSINVLLTQLELPED